MERWASTRDGGEASWSRRVVRRCAAGWTCRAMRRPTYWHILIFGLECREHDHTAPRYFDDSESKNHSRRMSRHERQLSMAVERTYTALLRSPRAEDVALDGTEAIKAPSSATSDKTRA